MNTTVKTILIIVIVVLALSLLPMIFGWGMMGGGMMGPGRGGWGMGWGFGWIFGLLFMAALVAGVVWLVTFIASSGTSPSTRQEESALDILKKRYAKGEINKQEFEDKKKDLTS